MMTAADYNGAFLFCRIVFRNSHDGDGAGWGVDYPRADINLTFRLSELSKTPVTRDEREGYNHVVLRLTDPLLSHCPFTMMTEPGGAYFDEAEAAALHDYGLKGGFLWADDFWSDFAFSIWAREIGKAFSTGTLPDHRRAARSSALSRAVRHQAPRAESRDQLLAAVRWRNVGTRRAKRRAARARHP